MNYEDLLQGLNPIEIIEFKNYLFDNITEIISTSNGNFKIIEDSIKEKYCPCCGALMKKNGHAPNGTQKYICKHCGETLSSTSATVTYCSKKNFSVWKGVIDCLIDDFSIRKTAKKLKIDKNTVFEIRHKIFQGLSQFLNKIKLTDEIEGDEQYKSINLKGTKSNKMPRYSKRRKSSGLSGISHHKVCIVAMLDSYDNLKMKIAGLGPVSTKMLEDTMKDFVTKNSLLITDSKTAYIKFCKDNNLVLEQIPTGFHNTKNGHNIQELNGVHSLLNTWISHFKGVSIRHLQGYLDWFSYIFILSKKYEYEKMKTEMYKDLIVNDNYIKSTDICTKKYPVDLKIAYGEYHYGIFA